MWQKLGGEKKRKRRKYIHIIGKTHKSTDRSEHLIKGKFHKIKDLRFTTKKRKRKTQSRMVEITRYGIV